MDGGSRIKPSLPSACFLGFSPPHPPPLSFLLFVSKNCSWCPLQNQSPPSPPPSCLSPLLQALPLLDPTLPSLCSCHRLGGIEDNLATIFTLSICFTRDPDSSTHGLSSCLKFHHQYTFGFGYISAISPLSKRQIEVGGGVNRATCRGRTQAGFYPAAPQMDLLPLSLARVSPLLKITVHLLPHPTATCTQTSQADRAEMVLSIFTAGETEARRGKGPHMQSQVWYEGVNCRSAAATPSHPQGTS